MTTNHSPRIIIDEKYCEKLSKTLPFITQIGTCAQGFIEKATTRYRQGILSPPLSYSKVQTVYALFKQLNRDLENATKDWQAYFKQAILSAYRFKVIQLCSFKPKGAQTDEIDENRAKEFLQHINECCGLYSPEQAYKIITQKLYHNFENDLSLDLQTLSRYLHLSQYEEYLKKYEEILLRQNVEFIGTHARMRIFSETTKDPEFLRQLPFLLDKSDKLKDFILHLSDTQKRDKLLAASMCEICQNDNPKEYFRHYIPKAMTHRG